jgi:hypothetical protein
MITSPIHINKCLDSNKEWVWSCITGLCCKNYTGCCQNDFLIAVSNTGNSFSPAPQITTKSSTSTKLTTIKNSFNQTPLISTKSSLSTKLTTIENSFSPTPQKTTKSSTSTKLTTIKNSLPIFSNLGYFLLFTGVLIIGFGVVITFMVLCFCRKNRNSSSNGKLTFVSK